MKIIIRDFSNYGRSGHGYTRIYTKIEDRFLVRFVTTSDEEYCSVCGEFGIHKNCEPVYVKEVNLEEIKRIGLESRESFVEVEVDGDIVYSLYSAFADVVLC